MTKRREFIGGAGAKPGRALAAPGLFILAVTVPTACGSDTDSAPGDSSAAGVTTTIDTVDGVVHVLNTGLDGSHRFNFGRSGEGPGEFARAYSVVWLGDRLLALDTEHGRISEFTAGGEYLGQRRIRGGMSGGPGWPRFWRVGTDEAYYFRRSLAAAPGRWSEFAGVDSRGETGVTLVRLAGPSATITCDPSRDRTSFFDIPFGAERVQRPGPGGMLYSAMTDAYRIALSDADDDTVRVIERALSPEPISDDEWATGNSRYRAVRDSFCPRPSAPITC